MIGKYNDPMFLLCPRAQAKPLVHPVFAL